MQPVAESTLDVRADFPIFSARAGGQPLVYLDSASTSQKPAVGDRRRSTTTCAATTPTSTAASTRSRRRPTQPIERARAARGGVHGRPERGTIFTKNVTEAINLVAYSWGRANVAAGDAVLITQMEHHANIVPWQVLCRERGAELRYLEVDERGELSLDALDAELARGDVRLVAFAHVSNVLGTINPVAEIVARARAAGAATAHRRRPGGAADGGGRRRRWAPTSTRGPATRRSARPASGVLHGRLELLERMEPFLTGGDMIASVDRQTVDLERAAVEVRGGHADDRRGGRPRRRRRLPRGARHGPRARARARAHRATCSSACARCRACASSGLPSAERAAAWRRSRSRACIPTTSPSSPTAAACASARATTARSRSCAASASPRPRARASGVYNDAADIDALVRRCMARASFGLSDPRDATRREGDCAGRRREGLSDGRPLPRLHPRALQAPAELRRAGAARPARRSSTTRSAATSWACTSCSTATASRTCASRATAARSRRPRRRSPPRS